MGASKARIHRIADPQSWKGLRDHLVQLCASETSSLRPRERPRWAPEHNVRDQESRNKDPTCALS